MSKQLLYNIPDLLVNQFVSDKSMTESEATPIGTIIAFMGTTPPPAFIICDGSVYNIADYLSLSNHFKIQFGSINYFGGDGISTFAVPDLRNEFLRGYHGDSSDQLSGDIGKHQNPTKHANTCTYSNADLSDHWTGGLLAGKSVFSADIDDSYITSIDLCYSKGVLANNPATFGNMPAQFSSRPTNVAVLYCIKAECTSSMNVGDSNTYSTNPVVIGTWIDGSDIYRRVLDITSYITSEGSTRIPLEELGLGNLKDCVKLSGFVIRNNEYYIPLPYINQAQQDIFHALLFVRERKLEVRLGSSVFNDLYKLEVFIEYTLKA